jgi:preprotein translocase subunit SecA
LVQQPPPMMQPIPLPDIPKYDKPLDLEGPSIVPSSNLTLGLGRGGNGNAPSRRDDNAPPDWKGGRNDPCWCGSGQKYKKCHGK